MKYLKQIIRRVGHRCWGIRNFVYRAWIYRKWLAYDMDWDWASLAEIMEIKLRRMEDALANGYPTDKRAARECQIAAHVCRRLGADDYDLKALLNRVPEHDQELLGKLIGRKMRHWWS